MSVAKNNEHAKDYIDSYALEHNLTFAAANFRIADEHRRLKTKLQNSQWAIVRELAAI
mgnify:FL=1